MYAIWILLISKIYPEGPLPSDLSMFHLCCGTLVSTVFVTITPLFDVPLYAGCTCIEVSDSTLVIL